MAARSVVLDASTSRPSSSIRPWRSNSSASVSDSAPAMTTGLAVVAVVPRAQVPARVQRLAAQRAGRAARGQHPPGPGNELPRRGRGQPHPQPVEVAGLVVRLLFLGVLAGGDRLD